ncbi:hypothetical protein [Nonomuraea sp. NPDC050783]|uniref:hypothetical protein n=1 Tax=Nonomuraea sp. NPDC050783 TaxID=3154634 RepID=UPI003464EAB8
MTQTPVGAATTDTSTPGTPTPGTAPATADARSTGTRPADTRSTDARPTGTPAGSPGTVGHQPPVCPVCGGVTVGVGSSDYTPARGRLILTRGYCSGACSRPAPPA